jgi:hypothetical protein
MHTTDRLERKIVLLVTIRGRSSSHRILYQWQCQLALFDQAISIVVRVLNEPLHLELKTCYVANEKTIQEKTLFSHLYF